MTGGIILRDYQQAAVDEIRDRYRSGSRSTLFVLSTGGGKTVTFSYITKASQSLGKRTLVLVHRRELVSQASATFSDFGIEHGVVMSGRSGNRLPVQIGMVGTIKNRLRKIAVPDFVVVDEAHHATAASYRAILDSFPKARILGVTATPQRTDGTGLGDIFDAMVIGPSMRDLIGSGALAPFSLFGPPPKVDLSGIKTVRGDYDRRGLNDAMDRSTVTGDAVEHYRRLVDGKRAVAFCVSREHAQHVAEMFCGAGIPAERIDGTMDIGEREAVLARYSSGETLVLASCDLISEGFDLPAIEAAILLRPTQSLIIYLQQVGRALRPMPGKDRAVILDHCGNHRLHGFPDDDREWTLEGRRKGEKRQLGGIPVTTCQSCFACYPPSLDRCPNCGGLREKSGRTIEYVDGQLVEITREVERQRAIDLWMASERDQGRHPVLWPMLNADAGHVPASLTKASDGGRQGVKVRLMSGPTIFRPYATMPADQLRAVAKALGYKPFWAARTHFINRHKRTPSAHEVRIAVAELARSSAA